MDELDPVFASVATYFGVLSEPTRLKIIHALCQSEKKVNEIVAETQASQTNVSRHLGLMHRVGVVKRRREGNQVYYSITDQTLVELCRSVCTRIASTIDERQPMKKQFLKLIPATKKRAA